MIAMERWKYMLITKKKEKSGSNFVSLKENHLEIDK